jgi:hypothetical protein
MRSVANDQQPVPVREGDGGLAIASPAVAVAGRERNHAAEPPLLLFFVNQRTGSGPKPEKIPRPKPALRENKIKKKWREIIKNGLEA